MKIYATSDIHGNLEGLNPADHDIMIIAGDIAPLDGFSAYNVHEQKEWLQHEFSSFCKSYPDVQFCIIPGNHDMCLDPKKAARCKGHDMRIAFPSNVHLLIDRQVNIDGLSIYGTPHVPIIGYVWGFEAEHDELCEKFAKIPDSLDILITHTPPHLLDSCIDRSLQNGGCEAFGSSELTQAIYDKKPRYVFCGHIHTGAHSEVLFNQSVLHNVARVDERYEIAYEPLSIEV